MYAVIGMVIEHQRTDFASHSTSKKGRQTMAVRKEHFDDHDDREERDEQEKDGLQKRTRLTFDVSPELRKRIRIAAAKRDTSVGEYLNSILEEAVPEETIETQGIYRPVTNKTLDLLNEISEEISRNHPGQHFEDSTEMIRQMREERTKYLMGEE
jgi:predicted HicB family RNase H-like nuclease